MTQLLVFSCCTQCYKSLYLKVDVVFHLLHEVKHARREEIGFVEERSKLCETKAVTVAAMVELHPRSCHREVNGAQ